MPDELEIIKDGKLPCGCDPRFWIVCLYHAILAMQEGRL